jgi:DNA-binding transcriptional LysR family regulator
MSSLEATVLEFIEIEKKRAAIMLADEMDYAKAAEKMNIASAELKRQIASLEKQLCLYLFRPRQRWVELTEEGSYLIQVFRQSVALHDSEMSDGTTKAWE